MLEACTRFERAIMRATRRSRPDCGKRPLGSPTGCQPVSSAHAPALRGVALDAACCGRNALLSACPPGQHVPRNILARLPLSLGALSDVSTHANQADESALGVEHRRFLGFNQHATTIRIVERLVVSPALLLREHLQIFLPER